LSRANVIICGVVGCGTPSFIEKWITFVSRLGQGGHPMSHHRSHLLAVLSPA
jgi:hypothetical protein